jgi:hypothetical protein
MHMWGDVDELWRRSPQQNKLEKMGVEYIQYNLSPRLDYAPSHLLLSRTGCESVCADMRLIKSTQDTRYLDIPPWKNSAKWGITSAR